MAKRFFTGGRGGAENWRQLVWGGLSSRGPAFLRVQPAENRLRAGLPAPLWPTETLKYLRCAKTSGILRKSDTPVAASGKYFRILVLSMVALAIAWSRTRGADLERQLEEAVHREVVLGDLTGAMKEYRNILAQTDLPRPLAARALLQTGECMEKLGRGPEAYNSYRRIETEFADQAAMVEFARTRLATWIGPRNLRFEDGVPGKVPPAPWAVQAPANDAGYVAEVRRDACRSASCVMVTAPTNVPGQSGILKQGFAAAPYRGKTVRLWGWLRLQRFFPTTTGFRTNGDDDRGQLWLRVERTNGQIGFSDSMDDRPIRSGDWTLAEITGQIDEDARTIYLGVASFGGARAWVDDLSFEVVK